MKDWKTMRHIVQGRDHTKNAIPCQDYVEIFNDGNLIIAAVSDGIGSLSSSQVASAAAVRALINWIRRHQDVLTNSGELKELFCGDMIDDIRAQILEDAVKQELDPEMMDCNLAFVCILSDVFAICGCLGDCAVCVIGEKSLVLTCPSESANGTDTVMVSNARERMRVAKVNLQKQSIKGFLLTTDGLEDVVYRKNSSVIKQQAAVYMNAMLEQNPKAVIRELVDKLPSSCDDDISLAILSQTKEKITLPADPTWLCRCGCRNSLSVFFCRECNGDFIDMYQNADIGKDIPATFLELNRSPEKERRILGLPVQSAKPEKKEQPAAKEKKPEPREGKTQTNRPLKQNAGLPVEANDFFGAYPNQGAKKPTKPKVDRKEEKSFSGQQEKQPKKSFAGSGESDLTSRLVRLLLGVAVVNTLLIGALFVSNFSMNRQIRELRSQVQEFQQASQEHTGMRGVVSANFTHLKDKPGGEQIATIRKGEAVYLLDEEPQEVQGVQWLRVQTEQGDTGWCRSDAVSFAMEEPAS